MEGTNSAARATNGSSYWPVHGNCWPLLLRFCHRKRRVRRSGTSVHPVAPSPGSDWRRHSHSSTRPSRTATRNPYSASSSTGTRGRMRSIGSRSTFRRQVELGVDVFSSGSIPDWGGGGGRWTDHGGQWCSVWTDRIRPMCPVDALKPINNTIQYNIILCNAIQCNARDNDIYNVIGRNTIPCDDMQCHTIQSRDNDIQYDVIGRNQIQ